GQPRGLSSYRKRPDRLRVVRGLGNVECDLAHRPRIPVGTVQLIGRERSETKHPDLRQPVEPASRLVYVLQAEGSHVRRSRYRGTMTTVGQRRLSGESRLHLREMIDQVIGDAAYGFVGRIRSIVHRA